MPKVNLSLNLNEPCDESTFPIVEMIEALDDFVASIRSAKYGAPLEYSGRVFTPFGTVDWNYEVKADGEGESTAGADSGQPTVDPVEGVDGVRDGAGHADVEERAGASERQGPDEASGSNGEERD